MGKKILIADRSVFYRDFFKKKLIELGHNVVSEVSTGATILTEYINTSPDLVILDIFFPDISGLDILEKILSLDKNVKIIFCSHSRNENFIKKAFLGGAKAYLFKRNTGFHTG